MKMVFILLLFFINTLCYSQNIVVKTDSIYKVYRALDGKILLEANSTKKSIKNFKTSTTTFDKEIDGLPFTKAIQEDFMVLNDAVNKKIIRRRINDKTIYVDLRSGYFRQEKQYYFDIANEKNELELTLEGCNFTYNPHLHQIFYEKNKYLHYYDITTGKETRLRKPLDTKNRMDGTFSWVWAIYNEVGDLWLYQASKGNYINLSDSNGDFKARILVDEGENSDIYLTDDKDGFWQDYL